MQALSALLAIVSSNGLNKQRYREFTQADHEQEAVCTRSQEHDAHAYAHDRIYCRILQKLPEVTCCPGEAAYFMKVH